MEHQQIPIQDIAITFLVLINLATLFYAVPRFNPEKPYKEALARFWSLRGIPVIIILLFIAVLPALIISTLVFSFLKFLTWEPFK